MRKRCLSETNMLSLKYFYSHNKKNAERQLNLPVQTLPPYTGLVNYADQFSLASLPLVCLPYIPTSKIHAPQAQLHRHSKAAALCAHLLRTRALVPAYNRQPSAAEWKSHYYPVHRDPQLKNKIKFSSSSPDHSLKTWFRPYFSLWHFFGPEQS